MWYSLRRRQQLVEGREPAGLAVLPRERRRRGSVPGLRRAAGQQLAGSGDSAYPGRHHQQPLGEHVRRRRLLDVRRPGRSGLPLRRGPGRLHRRASTATRTRPATSSRWPSYKEKLRFNWNTPIHLSPNEKGTLYIGAQFLFRSRDHGQTWERISPDLTTNDPESRSRSNPAASPSTTPRPRCTRRSTRSASRRRTAGTIWVGTDDGNLQLTRDGGKTWTNVARQRPGPAEGVVGELGRGEPASTPAPRTPRSTATRSATSRLRLRDDATSARPGSRWSRRRTAKGVRGYAHVIKEDTQQPNLLFLGTEFGLWVSIDGGADLGAVQGRRLPGGRGARSRDPAARQRSRARDARPRHLDHRRHHAAARPDAGVLAQEAAFRRRRGPVQQRIAATGGWAEWRGGVRRRQSAGRRGDHLLPEVAPPVRQAEARGARSRRAAWSTTLPASKRRGLNRVIWSMREKPPRVPPAAQLAFAGTQARASCRAPTRCA